MDRLSLIKIDYFSCFSKFHSRLLIIVSLFFFISLAHDHWFDTVLCKPFFFCILSFVFFRFKIYSLHSQFNCVICSRFVDFSPVSLRWVGRTGSIGTIIDDNHHYIIIVIASCNSVKRLAEKKGNGWREKNIFSFFWYRWWKKMKVFDYVFFRNSLVWFRFMQRVQKERERERERWCHWWKYDCYSMLFSRFKLFVFKLLLFLFDILFYKCEFKCP